MLLLYSIFQELARLCHTGAKNRQRKIVTKFVIRCVCHTKGLKSWQIMKKMTHKNLKIVKKTSSCVRYLN